MSAVSDFVRQISDEVSELAMKEDNKLMDSIHVHPSPNVENAEKLGDFINKVENKDHCLQEGDFIFLFFNDADDYEERFGGRDDEETSVLGSRPILYLYRSDKAKRMGLKIGQASLGHERMNSHCETNDPDPIGENPGVVILKCNGFCRDDEFIVREVRELCEVLINRFMKKNMDKWDTIPINTQTSRVRISKPGREQAIDLIKALQEVVQYPQFRKIV
ncbi:uncharacterized protein METZ01_LOCUS356976 [marine metagenome]|uniref:Uncharacterized protein n=1 Tax=marine metagenome TaxID=408172 RepID=A0A382S3G9_9ZZZZ